MSDVLTEFEKAALEGLSKIRAFWDSQAETKSKAMEDARLGASTIGSYTRLRATMANEQAIELALTKVTGNGRRRLKSA